MRRRCTWDYMRSVESWWDNCVSDRFFEVFSFAGAVRTVPQLVGAGKNGKSVWTLWVGAFWGWAIAFAHDGAQYICQLSVSCICAHHAQFFQIPEISWNTENQHIRPWPSQLLFGDLWKTTSDRRRQCTCEGSLNYSLLDSTICGPPILEQFPNTERIPIVSFYRF